ncbi:MAG: glycerol kinase GlpK [Proteobacteria bacterium]|nr:glycerol kinase GlpK [Pseudomonadota bacterium]
MAGPLLLALDQGTTSARAMIFDAAGDAVALAQQEFPQHFPADGWVEHDGEDIWNSAVGVMRDVLAQAGVRPGDIAAMGITNQRETTLVWERATGRPIHRAIVWQDRRTAGACREHRHRGAAKLVRERTGLLIDPYFSATKIAWLLDHVEGARARAEAGELAFGTVDSFLLWRLTGGRVHATDATNASRTLLFDIARQAWDDELLDFFRVPATLLPEVRNSADDFGATLPELFGGAIAIGGIAGDQQAATVGQACFEPGMAKSTYGTGCFMIANTGQEIARSGAGLLSTVAYRLKGEPTYALEGSIFVAGAAVQWLRDALRLIGSAAETEALAMQAGEDGVYMVPAFTGLGAPHWDPHARGAIFGLTRDTGITQIARAALDAVCHQTHDLIGAMAADGAHQQVLRVDGGMTANRWFLQRLADLTGMAVERPAVEESSALGAACLAGLQAGVLDGTGAIAERWRADVVARPAMDDARRAALYEGWQDAVGRVLTRNTNEGEDGP